MTVSSLALGSRGFLKISDWQYIEFPNSGRTIVPPNRSKVSVPIQIRETTGDGAYTEVNIDAGLYGYQKSSAVDGWGDGFYFNDALDSNKCSIQAKMPGWNVIASDMAAISLQSGTVSHQHYTSNTIEHALIFGLYGQGQIRELGVIPPVNGYFKWEAGDIGLIELIDGVVRYYLIKPDGTMLLLRTTRSKLASDVYGEMALYGASTILLDVLVWSNVYASTSFEMIGVLEGFQDWFNDFSHSSTAEAIQMADNNPQFQFPNHKKRLRSLNASLNMRVKADRDKYLNFFNWHGVEEEFIFIDNAHKDTDNETTEFWARFGSPFGDKVRNSCLTAHQAVIMESYRNDYIPILADASGPTAPVIDNITELNGIEILLEITASTDNIELYEYKMKVGSGEYGNPVEYANNYPAPDHSVFTGTLSPWPAGTYYFQVRAKDHSGNYSAWSAEDSVVIT